MPESQDKKESIVDLQASLKGEFQQFLSELETQKRIVSNDAMLDEFDKYLDAKYGVKSKARDTLAAISGILNREVTYDDFKNMKINATDTLEKKHRALWLKGVEEKTKRGVYQSSFEHFEKIIRVDGYPKLSFKNFAQQHTDIPVFNPTNGTWKWKGSEYTTMPEFDENAYDELLGAKDRCLAFIEQSIGKKDKKKAEAVRKRLGKELYTSVGPTLGRIIETAGIVSGERIDAKQSAAISLKLQDDALALVDVQKSIELTKITSQYIEEKQKLYEYFTAQSGNCNASLLKKYPFKRFMKTSEAQSFRTKEDWALLEVEYYKWAKKEAQTNDEPEKALLAEAMILMRAGKTVDLEAMSKELKSAIMDQLVEQKFDLMKNLGFDEKLEELYEQQGLTPEQARKHREHHQRFMSNYLDATVTRHTIQSLDGKEYVINLKKNLTFNPAQAKFATSPANLVSLQITAMLGQAAELMTTLYHRDTLFLHDPITLRDKEKNAPGEEMNLIRSQEYIIRGPSGASLGQGTIDIIAVGDDTDEIIDKDNKNPALNDKIKKGKESNRTITVTNKKTNIKEYPFGKEGVKDPARLIDNYYFEPVGELAFRQEFALGGENGGDFAEHMAMIEQQALSLSVQEKFKPEGVYVMDEEAEALLGEESAVLRSFLKTTIVGADQIPQEILDSTPAIEVHAWIHEGKIFINADYFSAAHGLDKEDIKGFLDNEGYLNSDLVLAWVYETGISTAEREKREIIYFDFKRRTLHEKAHRVFDYYGLEDSADKDGTHNHEHKTNAHLEADGEAPIRVKTTEGEEVPISNELLSKVVEVTVLFSDDEVIRNLTKQQIEGIAHLLDYVFDDDGYPVLSLPIIQEGKTVYHNVRLIDIERALQEKIGPSFTFAKLENIDRDLVVNELKKDPNMRSFDDLTEASALTYDTMLASKITKKEVTSNPHTLYIYESNEADEAGTKANKKYKRADKLKYAQESNALPMRMGLDASTGGRYRDTHNKTRIEKLMDEDIAVIKKWIKDKEDKGIKYKVILPVMADGRSSLGEEHAMIDDPKSKKIMEMLSTKLGGINNMLADPVLEKKKIEDEENAHKQRDKEGEEAKEVARELALKQNQAEFNAEYRNFGGDESIDEPKAGDVLFMRDGISNWPGKKSDWLKVTIVGVTDEKVILKVSGHTERSLGSSEGKTVTIGRDGNGARRLKKGAKGKINRYKQQHSKSGFLAYQKDVDMPPQWGDISSDGIKKFSMDNEDHKGPITHIAVPVNLTLGQKTSNIYRVTRGSNKVTLQAETDKGLSNSHDFDYSSFLQFVADKNLNPYTQEEITRRGHFKTPEAKDQGIPKQHRFDKLASVGTLLSAGKNILETFKSKFTQNNEMDVVDLELKLMGLLPTRADGGLLYLDDVRNDTEAKKDAMTFKNIEKYKEMLTRSDIGNGIHGKKASTIIEKEIFQEYSSRRYYRFKTAGYLLYALDAGHPYFRKLAPYHGKGLWVKSLLGPEYHNMYMTQKKQRMDELKSQGVPDDEAQDTIAKFELYFIKTHTTDHPLYGTRFGRKVEDGMDARGNPEKISGAKSGAEAKGNTHFIYDMVKNGGIGNMSPSTYIGGLEGLEGEVEEPEDYKMFYKLILMGVMSGFTKMFSKVYMDKFKGICRRRGIPIGMYITHPDSSARVTRILDYISVKSGSGETFTQAMNKKRKKEGKGKWDPTKLNADNFTEDNQWKDVMSVMEGRWEVNGETTIAAFNYQEDFLIEGLVDESKDMDPKTKEAIEGYFGGGVVFNGMRDYKDTSAGKMPAGDNPFFDGVLNLAPGTFESYMFSVSGGRFRNEQSRDMRYKFGDSMDRFGGLLEGKEEKVKRPFMSFLMKKFQLYFAPRVGSKGMKMMKYYMMQEPNITSDPEWKHLNKQQREDLLYQKMELIARKYIYGDNSLKEQRNEKTGVIELVRAKDNGFVQSERLGEQALKDGTESMLRTIADNIYDINTADRGALISGARGK